MTTRLKKIKPNMPLTKYFQGWALGEKTIEESLKVILNFQEEFRYKNVNYFTFVYKNVFVFQINGDERNKEIPMSEQNFKYEGNNYIDMFQYAKLHDGRMFYEIAIDWDKVDPKDIEYI